MHLYIKSDKLIKQYAANTDKIRTLDKTLLMNLGHIRKTSVHSFGHNQSAKLKRNRNNEKHQ